jgi:hypothetical protein
MMDSTILASRGAKSQFATGRYPRHAKGGSSDAATTTSVMISKLHYTAPLIS